MAAGRDDNPRRREVYKYTKIEYEHSWKGSRDNRAVHRDYSYKQKNGNRFLSGEINSDHGKNGSYGRTEERKLVKLQTRSSADETYSKVGDPENEDQVQLPAEKRRKVSPNLLDRVENEVRIQCKNWITSVATLITPTKDETRGQELSAVSSRIHVLKNQGLEFSSDEPVSEVEYVETPLSSPASSFSSIRPNYFEENGQEKDGIEEEEVAHTRDIAMSRWASDSDPAGDICSSDDEETQKWRRGPLDLESPKQVIERYSSPESGEFQREDSDGNRVTVYDNDKGSLREADNGVVSSANDYDDTIMADVNEKHLDGLIVSEDGSEIQDKNDLEEPILPAQKSVNMLQECRSVFEYEKLNKISEGTYGIVYKAKDLKSGEVVALKKVKMNIDRDGFPLSSLREINIMSSFDHPSIVDVKEVVMDDLDSVFMVMEYMEYDLKKAMEVRKQPFSVSEVKLMMIQLLEGVKYLHDNWVLHRDLKTSNLLLNKDGNLKICDFGLSRQYGSPLKPYTPLVVTMWYRSPELLLGTKQYSTAIDMWSVGCIMAEMLTKEPLFRGKTEIDQLDKIFRTLGTPSDSIWPGFSELPGAKSKFVRQPYNLLRKKFPATSFTGSPVLSDSGFDLLNRLLTYNPEKRVSAEDALNHSWFCEVPLPKSDIKPLHG